MVRGSSPWRSCGQGGGEAQDNSQRALTAMPSGFLDMFAGSPKLESIEKASKRAANRNQGLKAVKVRDEPPPALTPSKRWAVEEAHPLASKPPPGLPRPVSGLAGSRGWGSGQAGAPMNIHDPALEARLPAARLPSFILTR